MQPTILRSGRSLRIDKRKYQFFPSWELGWSKILAARRATRELECRVRLFGLRRHRTGQAPFAFSRAPRASGRGRAPWLPNVTHTQAFSSGRWAAKRCCASSNRAYALSLRTSSRRRLGARSPSRPTPAVSPVLRSRSRRKRRRQNLPRTSEDLGGNRSLPLLGQSGKTQEHYSGVLLPSAVHQLTEVFIPSDKDR